MLYIVIYGKFINTHRPYFLQEIKKSLTTHIIQESVCVVHSELFGGVWYVLELAIIAIFVQYFICRIMSFVVLLLYIALGGVSLYIYPQVHNIRKIGH